MANVELNYYNGSIYEVLYPKIAWTNNSGGTIATANIPNLSASKITSGTFSADRIPTLNASKITTGTFGGSKGTEYIFPGNLRIGGTNSNSDAYLRIGDSDYVHLHEDTDDMLTIKAKRINFLTTNTPGLTNNGVALGGGGGYYGSYRGTGNYRVSVNYPNNVIPNIFFVIHTNSNALGINIRGNDFGVIFVCSMINGTVTLDGDTSIDFDDTYKYMDIQTLSNEYTLNKNNKLYYYWIY